MKITQPSEKTSFSGFWSLKVIIAGKLSPAALTAKTTIRKHFSLPVNIEVSGQLFGTVYNLSMCDFTDYYQYCNYQCPSTSKSVKNLFELNDQL